jgi:hypothetical protein
MRGGLVALSVAMVAVSCGSVPTSPSGRRLDLPSGPNNFRVVGGSTESPCVANGPISPTFQVSISVTVTLEGNDWVAKSNRAGDDFELRFHDTGEPLAPIPPPPTLFTLPALFGVPVTGTIRGSAVVSLGSLAPAILSFTGGNGEPAGRVSGPVVIGSVYVFGFDNIAGKIALTNSNGSTATCTRLAEWSLQTVSGG